MSTHNIGFRGEIAYITAHTPISAQLGKFLVFILKPVYFYLLYKSICRWYSFELPQQDEAMQMSTKQHTRDVRNELLIVL